MITLELLYRTLSCYGGHLCLVLRFDNWSKALHLNLSITNGIVSSKIYDKRDDFNFEIVNFPFLDGDVPRSPSYGVYIFSLFVLLECALMLVTSTTETYF